MARPKTSVRILQIMRGQGAISVLARILAPPQAAAKLQDGAVVLINETPVRFKVNGRARRVSLRIDQARGEVVAIAPTARRLGEALKFAESRSQWIAKGLHAVPERRPFAPGLMLDVDGAPCRLERAAMRIKANLTPARDEEPARLLAFGEGEVFSRAVARALKAKALDRLEERTAAHVLRLGLTPPTISVADARMRWGSCRQGVRGQPGKIRYNWRLILAPAWVLDYVAAHEVAHLVHPNHSAAYWAVVHDTFGDHRPARAWLRANGASLHAVGA